MSRPRRAFISVLLTALPLLTACAPEPAVHAFRLTEPAAPVELLPVPGDRTDFAWTFDAELAERIDVVVYAVPTVAGESWIGLGASALDRGGMPYVVDHAPTWLTPVVPGQPPPGVYRVQARAWAWVDPEAGETEELAAAFAPGLLVMQGVTFRDRALTFVSADLDRDIWMTTVTASVARAIVYLAATVDGPRHVVADGTFASDLAPVGRVVSFTGRTIDDVAIPAGVWSVYVEVRARGGVDRYVTGGLTIDWRP